MILIIQKFLASDDHSGYADGSQLQWCFITNSNKLKSHTSTSSIEPTNLGYSPASVQCPAEQSRKNFQAGKSYI